MLRSIYIFLFFVLVISLKAQYYNEDASLWLNAEFEKELSNKLDLRINLQNRFNNNFTQYKQFAISTGVKYKLNKHIHFSFDYMFREKRRIEQIFSIRHRFYAAIYLRKKFDRFSIVYRNRTQMQLKNYYSSEKGKVPMFYNRNKITVKYELNKRIDLYASTEVFIPLKASSIYADRFRNGFGLNFKLSSKSSVSPCFYYQQELYKTRQLRKDFIYALSYQYQF